MAQRALKLFVRASSLWILFAVLFLLAAHLPYLTSIYKQYAALFLAILWFMTALGFDNLLRRMRITPVIDWLDSKAGRFPLLIVSVLLCITTISFVCVCRIVSCLSVKAQYQAHITQYSSSKDISELIHAFTLVPRRQETMILFEQHLLSLSAEMDPPTLRKAAEKFVDNAEIQALFAKNAMDANSHCLCANSDLWLDPTLWYAMVLPMAESHHDTVRKEKARRLLENRPDVASRVFIGIIDLELSSLDRATNAFEKLHNLIKPGKMPDRSHLIQEALDHLAQYELTMNNCNLDRAVQRYATLLQKREAVARAFPKEGMWIRSPRKLSLFHIFRALKHEGRQGETIQEARTLLNHCDGLRDAIQRGIYDVFPSYQSESSWFTNTLVGPGVSSDAIEARSSSCWSY